MRRAEARRRAAEDVVREFEAEARAGTVLTGDARSVETALVGAALRHQGGSALLPPKELAEIGR